MANVIICCDGTWNTFDQRSGALPAPTNITRIFAGLAKTDANGIPQKKFYRKGVGTTGGTLARLLDGAFASNINNDIISAYKALGDLYRPSDEIFIFGFSRGAFAARSLSGLIDTCGIPDFTNIDPTENQRWEIVKQAFERYRTKNTTDLPWPHHTKPKIHFLGVFDTVGALGIPDEGWILKFPARIWNYILSLISGDRTAFYKIPKPKGGWLGLIAKLRATTVEDLNFHDVHLSNSVTTARHALGIDERRIHFRPTLWQNLPPNADVQQVWFPGVHSDIGGGYPRSGLSDTTLRWMMKEASKKGLQFDPQFTKQIKPDYQDVLNESATSVFARFPLLPRSVPEFEKTTPQVKVHKSARCRRAKRPFKQPVYWDTNPGLDAAPKTVTIHARRRWHPTGMFLRADTNYSFRANGEWIDSTHKCGPDGFASSSDLFGPHSSLLPDTLELAKAGLLKLFPEASLPMTRRHLDINWFCLTGVIANGQLREKPEDRDEPHQHFAIGTGTTFTPKRDGWLYCYPNDAWRFYQNNKGSVQLTVTKM